MGNILKFSLYAIMAILISSSCNSNTPIDEKSIEKAAKVALIEKRIGESNFYISIPLDYSITKSNGPDFSVYYFSPTDTTIKDKLSGGLYLGNYPHKFDADNDSCKTTTIKGKILDSIQDWTVYNCKEGYSMQIIVDNKNGEDWYQKIHAFGFSENKDDLQTILDIYATLRKK